MIESSRDEISYFPAVLVHFSRLHATCKETIGDGKVAEEKRPWQTGMEPRDSTLLTKREEEEKLS